MKAHLCLAAALCVAPAFAQDKPATPQATPQQQSSPTATKPDQSSMPAKGDLPEMKTTSFKGTLVDMSCAGSGSAAPSTAGAAAPAASNTGADRTCAVSSNSKQFGLKTVDGKVVPFDMVGNQRAQDQVAANKKWNQAASSGKEIKVKISGVMSGEKLVVSSIK